MDTQNQNNAGESPAPDLRALKASLQELKKRFLNSTNAENKFATQNKVCFKFAKKYRKRGHP